MSKEQMRKLTEGWDMDMIRNRMKKIDRMIDSYNQEYLFLNSKLEHMEDEDFLDATYGNHDVVELTLDETEKSWRLTEGSAPFDDRLDDTSLEYLCQLGRKDIAHS